MKDATLKELGPGSLTTKHSQLLQSCNESLWKVFEPRVFKQPWAEISQRFQRNLSGTLARMDRALVATDDTEYSGDADQFAVACWKSDVSTCWRLDVRVSGLSRLGFVFTIYDSRFTIHELCSVCPAPRHVVDPRQVVEICS
jgi:hypothetical protein